MPLIGGARTLFTGDSISVPTGGTGTAWYDSAVASINAYYAAHPRFEAARGGSVSGTQARNTGVPATLNNVADLRMEVFNSAVAGSQMVDLYNNRSTRIYAYAPLDAVVIRVGVNDVPIGGSWATTYTSLITDMRATLGSSLYVVLHAVLCRGELWQAGPAWGPNADDNAIAAVNTAMSGVASANNCVFVDDRANLLAWEAVNNAPAPGIASGKFTSDTIHPIPATAWSLMSSWLYSAITLET